MKKLFSLCVAALAMGSLGGVASAQEWGSLEGSFVLQGEAPAPAPIAVDKDKQFCGNFGLVDESLVVDKRGRIQNVFVYLRSEPTAVHPDYEKSATEEVVLDNNQCRFEPHALAVRAGQPVKLKNSDQVGHNVKMDLIANNSINPLIPANGAMVQKFEQKEIVPLPASCSIHPWMLGYVLIRDNPYMAVSDDRGSFEIANLPVGEHTFQVWQEKSGFVQDVVLEGKETKWEKGRFTITIKPGKNDLGKIEIPLAAFQKN